jgi:hypothetical protein
MQFNDSHRLKTFLFRGVLSISILSMFAVTGMYMVLGTFSRYMSDDFCETVLVTQKSPLGAVIDRYTEGEWRAANRYSNLLFVGFSEWLGPYNVQIVIPLMILLWVAGLGWAACEAAKLLRVSNYIEMGVFAGTFSGFFTILQAPHLFQTLYWRSSMFTHFAPVVFGTFLLAFVLGQANHPGASSLAVWKYLVAALATFVIAGFSEPPIAMMLTGLTLAILAIRRWVREPTRGPIIKLLMCAFAGAFLGLMVMVFSPASLNLADENRPAVVALFSDTFLFAFEFVSSTFRTLPLPSVISMILPALLTWLYVQLNSFEISEIQKKHLRLMLLAAPLVAYLLIAAGFSPSVYGQGFPVERMRFAARWVMTLCLMFEGGVLGLLLSRRLSSQRYLWQAGAACLFLILAIFYPLRALLHVYGDVPEYRERAELWDLRDDYIHRHASLGETEIVIPGFSGVYGVKELDDDATHWVNMCAAEYYGVNSIRTVPVPDEYLRDFFSE